MGVPITYNVPLMAAPPVLLVSGRDSGQLLNLFPRPEYKIAEGRLRMAFLLFCPPAEIATEQCLDF